MRYLCGMEIIKNDTVYKLYQKISKFFFEKPKIISTFFNPKICYSSIFDIKDNSYITTNFAQIHN